MRKKFKHKLLIKNFITMKNLKKLSREELKTVNGGKLPTVWYAETSCGVTATTTQDWTPQQAQEWFEKIEQNYCPPPTHSGSSTNLA
ncbi:hypothetical protein GCM10022217_39260 [Chryseobacterium ginsenosidimutans]|uniref:bacteriocin-like protein n=1 Tax=Chryseobacterium ginsenosidimutans TaxID=687846 RepID=UPI0031DD377E